MMGGAGGSKHFYGNCLQNNVKGQTEMTEDSQLSSLSYMTQFPKCGPVSSSHETVTCSLHI